MFCFLVLGASALAFWEGRRIGRRRACDDCLRDGITMGFKVGLLEGKEVNIQIEKVQKSE